MAIPDYVLSSLTAKHSFLYPDSLEDSKTRDYEYGGIALNDGTRGLRVKVWEARIVNQRKIYVSSEDYPDTLLYEGDGITEVSLAFDQNMRPFIAFFEAGNSKYRWYDTSAGMQVVTTLAPGCITPRACVDDKRQTQTANSDITLMYMRAKHLYMRVQRDRYLVEYDLAGDLDAELVKIGMNNVGRVQAKLKSNV